MKRELKGELAKEVACRFASLDPFLQVSVDQSVEFVLVWISVAQPVAQVMGKEYLASTYDQSRLVPRLHHLVA